MDKEHPRAASLCPFSFQRFSQPLHRRGHGRRHRTPGLAFHQRHRTGASGHKKIYFKTLLIAKIVQLAPTAGIHLGLDHLCRNEAFE